MSNENEIIEEDEKNSATFESLGELILEGQEYASSEECLTNITKVLENAGHRITIETKLNR